MRLKKVLSGACMASLFAFSFSACSENQPEYDYTIVTPDTTTIVPELALPNSLAGTSETTYKAFTSRMNFDTAGSGNANPMIKIPAQTISAKSTVALNPAHGLPGHRCDIQVGAPLNSAPKVPGQSPSTSPTLVQPSQPGLSIPLAGSGRINPPHGQPGHSCAIPVGQPLK